MIQREKIEELLKLPTEERRRVLRLLQESLTEEGETVASSTNGDQTSPAAKWLLSMAGRYSGGPVILLPAPMRSSALRSISTVGSSRISYDGPARLWISVCLAQCLRIRTPGNNSRSGKYSGTNCSTHPRYYRSCISSSSTSITKPLPISLRALRRPN